MTVELRFICKVRTAADSREVFYIVLFCFIFFIFFCLDLGRSGHNINAVAFL